MDSCGTLLFLAKDARYKIVFIEGKISQLSIKGVQSFADILGDGNDKITRGVFVSFGTQWDKRHCKQSLIN